MQTLFNSLVFDAGTSPVVTITVIIGIIVVLANVIRAIGIYVKSHSEKRRLTTWEKENQEVITLYQKTIYFKHIAAG